MSPFARVASVILGGVAWGALAVLGWGGLAPFFANPARIALALGLAALTFVSCFAGGNLSPGEREDRGNRWVLAAFGVSGLLLGWLPAYTDRLDLLCIDGDTTRWIGIVLYLLGGALRLWPVFVLGNRFSGLVAIQAGHTLVTTGPYAIIRHPSYLGLLGFSLGWSLAFRAAAGVLLTVLILPPLLARISAEERLLKSQFGDEYEAYRARTARLIPGIF